MMNCSKRMLVLLAVLVWCCAGPVAATVITDVRVSDEGEKLRFILSTDQVPGEPTVFTTDQPPRIVLELADTTSNVAAAQVPVGIGPVRSYMALSSGDRTRLVVDLSRSTSYQVGVEGNQVVLSIDTSSGVGRSSVSTVAGRLEVAAIDFRRATDGSGRVIVDLDQPGVNVSVDQRASELRINLFDTRLPERLMQRLDVSDFATPVQTITPEVRGENLRLNLGIAGSFSHVVYQSDRQLVIEVAQPQQEEPMTRDLEFFEEREFSGERITLNFQDIPVRSVLQLIADISDLNIVVSDSVTGNLTLRLTNVPWDQALEIVLETRNLDMRESGNVRWVAPAAEIAAREQQILRARADRQTLEPLRTVMIPVSYSDATSLAELIRSAASSSSNDEGGAGLLSVRGSVTLDERTNTLLVTDTAEQIESVRALVAALDRPVRQVLIESRIVIARSTFSHELGVRFGVSGTQNVSGDLLSLSGSAEATDRLSNVALARRQFLGQRPGRPAFLPDGDPPDNPGDPIDVGTNGIAVPRLQDRLNVNLPVASPAGALGISFLANNFLLDLELSALEAQGEGEVISTPRVIAANQTESYIKQGVEIPFEQATNSGATNIEFKDAVLELRVTPLITPDNRVQLDLLVKQDTVGEILTPGLEPSIDKRELGTKILVENGQTVVLGGILQEERNFNSTKVPMLGDLPVLGSLFRRRSTEDEKRELLIFVTPTILDEQVLID